MAPGHLGPASECLKTQPLSRRSYKLIDMNWALAILLASLEIVGIPIDSAAAQEAPVSIPVQIWTAHAGTNMLPGFSAFSRLETPTFSDMTGIAPGIPPLAAPAAERPASDTTRAELPDQAVPSAQNGRSPIDALSRLSLARRDSVSAVSAIGQRDFDGTSTRASADLDLPGRDETVPAESNTAHQAPPLSVANAAQLLIARYHGSKQALDIAFRLRNPQDLEREEFLEHFHYVNALVGGLKDPGEGSAINLDERLRDIEHYLAAFHYARGIIGITFGLPTMFLMAPIYTALKAVLQAAMKPSERNIIHNPNTSKASFREVRHAWQGAWDGAIFSVTRPFTD